MYVKLFYDISFLFQGVQVLGTVLPNLVHFHMVEPEKFNHNDFIFIDEAKPLVYDKALWYILQFLKK